MAAKRKRQRPAQPAPAEEGERARREALEQERRAVGAELDAQWPGRPRKLAELIARLRGRILDACAWAGAEVARTPAERLWLRTGWDRDSLTDKEREMLRPKPGSPWMPHATTDPERRLFRSALATFRTCGTRWRLPARTDAEENTRDDYAFALSLLDSAQSYCDMGEEGEAVIAYAAAEAAFARAKEPEPHRDIEKKVDLLLGEFKKAGAATSRPDEPALRGNAAEGPVSSIARDGSCWRICHEGTTGTYPDHKGFRILAEFLMNPNKDLDCLTLARRVRESNWTPEPAAADAVQALEQSLAEARARGDAAEAADLREQLERVSRRSEAPDKGRARRAVGKALDSALNHIQRSQPRLAAALRRDIMTPYGAWVSYRPPGGTRTWLASL